MTRRAGSSRPHRHEERRRSRAGGDGARDRAAAPRRRPARTGTGDRAGPRPAPRPGTKFDRTTGPFSVVDVLVDQDRPGREQPPGTGRLARQGGQEHQGDDAERAEPRNGAQRATATPSSGPPSAATGPIAISVAQHVEVGLVPEPGDVGGDRIPDGRPDGRGDQHEDRRPPRRRRPGPGTPDTGRSCAAAGRPGRSSTRSRVRSIEVVRRCATTNPKTPMRKAMKSVPTIGLASTSCCQTAATMGISMIPTPRRNSGCRAKRLASTRARARRVCQPSAGRRRGVPGHDRGAHDTASSSASRAASPTSSR